MTENKQIQEMARDMCPFSKTSKCCECSDECFYKEYSKRLYAKNYRKVERGEWKRIEINGKHYGQIYYQHSDCPINQTQMFPSPYNACPNCGADMRGEKE